MVRRMGSSVYNQALSLSFSDTRVTEGGSTSEDDGVEKGDGHPGKTYPAENTGGFRKHYLMTQYEISITIKFTWI